MRKWLAGLGILGVVYGGVGVPSAQAATDPQITSVKAANVVVYANGYTTHDIYVTVYDPSNVVYGDPNRWFDVEAVPSSGVSNGWNAPAWYPGDGVRTSNGSTYDIYRFRIVDEYNADSARGWRNVTVDLWAGDSPWRHYSKYKAFMVRSNTIVGGFNATEPVTRGNYTKLTGRLLKLEYPWQWDGYQYRGYAYKTVYIQFKRAGTSGWVTKASTTTSSTGWFTKYVRAYYDGTWRAYFPGNSWARPRYSYGDYVDVR